MQCRCPLVFSVKACNGGEHGERMLLLFFLLCPIPVFRTAMYNSDRLIGIAGARRRGLVHAQNRKPSVLCNQVNRNSPRVCVCLSPSQQQYRPSCRILDHPSGPVFPHLHLEPNFCICVLYAHSLDAPGTKGLRLCVLCCNVHQQ